MNAPNVIPTVRSSSSAVLPIRLRLPFLTQTSPSPDLTLIPSGISVSTKTLSSNASTLFWMFEDRRTSMPVFPNIGRLVGQPDQWPRRVLRKSLDIPIFRNDTHFRPLVARLQFHTAPIFARCSSTRVVRALHFLRERRQRRGVALGQLANAARESICETRSSSLCTAADRSGPSTCRPPPAS